MKKSIQYAIRAIILTFVFIAVNGCEGWQFFETPLLANQNKTIHVGLLKQALSGFENDLLKTYAKENGLEFKINYFDDTQKLLESYDKNEIEVVAGRFVDNEWVQNHHLLPSSLYDEQELTMACHPEIDFESPIQFFSRFDTLSTADKINIKNQYPRSQLIQLNNINMKRLQMLKTKKQSCLFIDKIFQKLILPLFPDLKYQDMDLSLGFHIYFSQQQPELVSTFSRWLQSQIRSGKLNEIRFNYFEHLNTFTSADYRLFEKRIRSRWPHLKKHIQNSAHEFGFPWQTIAAVSFRESQWEAQAESHKNAMGLMQLTWPTAQHLGVDDPFDPQQSLWGGAKYLRQLSDSFDEELTSRNRFIFSLIAYNMGYAHLVDAFQLAEDFGLNSSQWIHIKKILPLMRLPTIIPQLKYGQANGFESMNFVDGILTYLDWFDLLALNETTSKPQKQLRRLVRK
jgi:membrane-bound lytic murein transglycosylase F